MLLGLGAFMHPATVKAALPPGYCQSLYADCQHGDQSACAIYKSVCFARGVGSMVIGTPLTKSNSKSDTAWLNSNWVVLVAE